MRLMLVGLGPLGQRIARDARDRGIHVVEAVDVSPSLAGRELASVVDGAEPNVLVRPRLDEVERWGEVDAAVVATASDLVRCAETFRTLLGRGLAVVSTCEQLVWPWLRHGKLAADLHATALSHGGRLLGAGVNPGFLMDALPVLATAACRSVDRVKVQRIQDAAIRRIPFQQKIGAGLTEADFEAGVASGTLGHVGLPESLHFIASCLSLRVDRWTEDVAPVLATEDLPSGVGVIRAGRVAGIRQSARGYSGVECVVDLEFQAAVGQPHPRDRIVIEGDPPLDFTISGGVHGDTATSALALNAVPSLLAAQPGLHTMATIPAVRCVRFG